MLLVTKSVSSCADVNIRLIKKRGFVIFVRQVVYLVVCFALFKRIV